MINTTQQNFIIISTIIFVFYIFFIKPKYDHFETGCSNQTTAADQTKEMGTTAKEACNRISSKAEEIEATYGGTANILKNLPIYALFNPNNYKSGESTTSDIARNIINTNLSECDIQKINNDCKNSSASVQLNEIDNTMCEYCKTHLCETSNITQENVSTINQLCLLQSAVETLSKKTDSTDAQALAKVLQKAEGLLSGDTTFRKENCNVLSTDLSSVKYLENNKSCANELTLDQKNSMKNCGNATNIIQRNQFKGYQKCLEKSSSFTDATFEKDTKIKTETEAEQVTTGVTPTTSIISSIVSGIVLGAAVSGIVLIATNKGVQESVVKVASAGAAPPPYSA